MGAAAGPVIKLFIQNGTKPRRTRYLKLFLNKQQIQHFHKYTRVILSWENILNGKYPNTLYFNIFLGPRCILFRTARLPNILMEIHTHHQTSLNLAAVLQPPNR